MEHRYALIVGIDSYSDTNHFMPLPFAQADARALYELLIDPERVEESNTVSADQPALAMKTESKQKTDLADANAGNTDGRPDVEKGT